MAMLWLIGGEQRINLDNLLRITAKNPIYKFSWGSDFFIFLYERMHDLLPLISISLMANWRVLIAQWDKAI